MIDIVSGIVLIVGFFFFTKDLAVRIFFQFWHYVRILWHCPIILYDDVARSGYMYVSYQADPIILQHSSCLKTLPGKIILFYVLL
jgi:hypothetical protein